MAFIKILKFCPSKDNIKTVKTTYRMGSDIRKSIPDQQERQPNFKVNKGFD